MTYKSKWKETILPLLPPLAAAALAQVSADAPVTELRLRAGQPFHIQFDGYARLLFAAGGRPVLRAEDCEGLLSNICGQALYAWTDELKNGFVTLPGGHRAGVAGRAITEGRHVERLEEVTAFCIRVMRELRGISKNIVPRLLDAEGYLLPTLIVSPPGCGKTTLLRDMIRAVSAGDYGAVAQSVSVADERYEIAGSVRGLPQFALGPRCDVMSGMRKPEAIARMIVAMCPQVIAADELRNIRDTEAILYAKSCGVTPLATAHADSLPALFLRNGMRPLQKQRVFARYVLLTRRGGAGSLSCILDADGREAA